MDRRGFGIFLLALAACSTTPSHPLHLEDEADAAAAYAAAKRSGTGDLERSYAVARDAMARMPRYATGSEESTASPRVATNDFRPLSTWTFLGPGNIGGRTRAFVIDPSDTLRLYAGGVSGGIWRTNNGGAQWTPVGDALSNIAVNALVMHPVNHDVLYAGTGEGYFREDVRGTGLPLRGDGIYVTRDRGTTWTQIPSTANENFYFVNSLTISTHDPSRMYAATRTGVWRSNDGGEQWTRVLDPHVNGGCLQLAFRGDTANDFLFASCGTLAQATVYRARAAETEAAWEPVLSNTNQGLTSLAIAPSNPSVVYALAASNQPGNFNQGLLAVYRSEHEGDAGSWEPRATNNGTDFVATMLLTNPSGMCAPEQQFYTTMGWYCNVIAVDPVDANRVWAAGVDLFRSDDGGVTWGRASSWEAEGNPWFVHADQHAIVFDPYYDGASNRTLYTTSDGGVFRTLNAVAPVGTGKTAACSSGMEQMEFESLNHNYGVTQFYHGAVFPDGRHFVGGAQDNGTLFGTFGEADDWQRWLGGDGGYVAIDPQDPTTMYAESQWANIEKLTHSLPFFIPASDGLSDDFLFVTPFVLDANDSKRLWTGGRRLWRTDNRATLWRAASTALPAQVSAVAVAPGNSKRVLAGTTAGHIARNDTATTANGFTTWTLVQPRVGWISSITFDPSDQNVVYATFAGFGGGAHVWRSLDGGATWSARDGSGDAALPDIPVHSLAVDPTHRDHLYLGTDLGVFVSLDSGDTWAVENTGFAAVVTEWVTVAPGARGPAVYAFTHGRGAWRAELTATGPRHRGVRH
ncbi:MAG: hypothetical protein JO197_14935 [Acidobacteria bacterium]|nr:hypothetical protein [Acidobacteriota bacterium]MBV9478842.1 hypothetical protein [Acidobacteriota bacterium]